MAVVAILKADYHSRWRPEKVGNRKDVPDAMYTTIRDDATVQVLTGADASDPRVYASHSRKDRVVDSTYKAFLTVDTPTEPQPFLDRHDFPIQVSIFAVGRNRARDIEDRLDVILDGQALAATGWTDVWMVRGPTRSTYDSGRGVWQTDIEYRVRVY